jgi:hypothetical protein
MVVLDIDTSGKSYSRPEFREVMTARQYIAASFVTMSSLNGFWAGAERSDLTSSCCSHYRK